MKRFLTFLLLAVPALAAPFDFRYSLRNAGNTAFNDITLAEPNATRVLQWNNTTNRFEWAVASVGDAVLAANQTFTGQNTFSLSPRISRTDLAAGTALTVGTHYWVALSANRTLTFSGSPADGDEISLELTVTGGPHVLTVPTSYRIGSSSTTTSISLPTGNHLVRWLRINSTWVMTDSGVDAEAAYAVYGNWTGGSLAPTFTRPTSALWNAALTDPTGTGLAVFGTGPAFTSYIVLPNAAAPVTDATGEFALDTTITDHQPMLQYYGGANEMLVPAILRADLTTTDGHVIVYDAAADKFKMAAAGGTPAGSGTELQYRNAGAFGAVSQTSYDGTTATYTIDSLGVTPSPAWAFRNSTAAAAGAQQASPTLRFTGQGWKTNATAGSQEVIWRVYNLPVQSTVNPATRLMFGASINGGAFTDLAYWDSGGAHAITGSLTTSSGLTSNSGGITTSSTSFFSFSTRSRLYSSADGAIELRNAANSANASLTAAAITSSSTIASTATTPGALGVGATTLAVTSNVATVTGDGGGNTLATITGGVSGMVLTLIFADANVTITDDASAGANTVNLSAAWTSTANDTLTLVHNGTSWREVARSVN